VYPTSLLTGIAVMLWGLCSTSIAIAAPDAHYRFDEYVWVGSFGEVKDFSGNAHHATSVAGAKTVFQTPALGDTNNGTCRYGRFDGVNDAVFFLDSKPLATVNTASVAAWVRCGDCPTQPGLHEQRTIASIGTGWSHFGYVLGMDTKRGWMFAVQTTQGVKAAKLGKPADSNWHFVVGVFDGNKIQLYVDGKLVNENVVQADIVWHPKQNTVMMGATLKPSNAFRGDIDEVAFYKTSLSGQEVFSMTNTTHACVQCSPAVEVCDGVDNDCNGYTDDIDQDGDGASVCTTDCDDSDPTIYENAPELCDSKDNDCNGQTDELGDNDQDNYTPCTGDCNDYDPTVYPGAPETCDYRDNDCNNVTDDPFPTVGQTCDGDDTDQCAEGVVLCTADKQTTFCANDGPNKVDVCNGLDDDCDGVTDDGDTDQDGSSNCLDCVDDDAAIYPGASEVCDGIDNDCDGKTDEGIPLLGKVCEEGSACVTAGVWICGTGNTLTCSGGPKPVGSNCDDGNLCTYLDNCAPNLTCGGIPYTCNDGLDATVDTCDGNGGCNVTVLPGKCVVAGLVYSDGDPDPNNACKLCLSDVSAIQFSPRPNGTPCNDGTFCTYSDGCLAGVCTGTLQSCDDNNSCTVDTCAAAVGCQHDATALEGSSCEDGNLCTTQEKCASGSCVAGSVNACDDGTPCTVDICNPFTGCLNIETPGYQEVCYSGAAGTSGVGQCVSGLKKCVGTALTACQGEVTPTTDLCDGLDNDCDGSADEDFGKTGEVCDSDDSDLCANGLTKCSDDGSSLICHGDTSSPELCDGLDNNCDGQTDEDFSALLNQPCDDAADDDQCVEGVYACHTDGTLACVNDGPMVVLLADETYQPIYSGVDSSGNQNHAKLHMGLSMGTGVRGGGFAFDGDNDWLEVAPKALLGTALKKGIFTFSLFYRWDGTSKSMSLLESSTGLCPDLAIRINANGAPYVLVEQSNCGFASIVGGFPSTANVWNHLVLTADGSNYRLYFNGKLKKTVAQTGTLHEWGVLWGGRNHAGVDSAFSGDMDEIGIWTEALDLAAVQKLHSQGIKALWVNNEICDGLDNNCDGQTDEHAISELCDGLDNDCDGQTDETFTTVGTACDDTDTDQCFGGIIDCNATQDGTVCIGDGPRVLWRMDAGTGSVAYDYAGVGHGTITNGTWQSGVVGSAVALAGDGHVQLSGYSLLDLVGIKTLTFGAHVRLTQHGASTIVSRGNAYTLSLDAVGIPTCSIPGVGPNQTTATASGISPITLNQWTLVGCVYDGAGIRLYVNGELAALVSGFSGAVSTGDALVSAGNGLVGAIDNVGIWDWAWGPAFIADLAANSPPAPQTTREICDVLDNDCDGATDEGYGDLGQKCDTLDQDLCANGTWTCTVAGDISCLNDTPENGIELCDGLDNDCDDLIDEDFGDAGQACDGTGDGDSCLEGVRVCGSDGLGLTCGRDGATVLYSGDRCEGATVINEASETMDGTMDASVLLDVGKVGNAFDVSLGGTIATPHDDAMNMAATGGTIAMWMKSTSLPDGKTASPISKGAGSARVFEFKVYGSQSSAASQGRIRPYFRFSSSTTSKYCTSSATVLPQEGWVHVAITLASNVAGDNTTMSVYKNGALLKACTYDGLLVDDDQAALKVGRAVVSNSDNDAPYPGLIDEFVLYNYPLSAGEVESLATTGLGAITRNRELCNGLDDDCDLSIDEGFVVGGSCDGKDADQCANGTLACRSSGLGTYCKGDGPVAQYAFDETSGNFASPASGVAPYGHVVGATQWTTGVVGGALSFSATGDRVSVAPTSEMESGQPLSFGSWIRLGSASLPLTTILKQGSSTVDRFWLQVSGSGQVICGIGGASQPTCAGTIPSVDVVSFHHALCTYDGTQIRVYADGLESASCASTGAIAIGSGPLQIGALDATPPTPLVFDEPSVWTAALSAKEAVMLVRSGEACDGVDNDCDGETDESFTALKQACDGDDADLCPTGINGCDANLRDLICQNDTNQVESCDGVDNDCDGATDEDYSTLGENCDGPDADECANGTLICDSNGGGVICNGDQNLPELCDGLDNDCNGVVDDNIPGINLACEGADADQCKDGLSYCSVQTNTIECDDVRTALWLKLDENAGASVVSDSSRYAASLKNTNGTLGATGKAGGAIEWTQAGRVVDTQGTVDGLSLKTSATWAAWVYPMGAFAAQSAQTIAAQWSPGAQGGQYVFRLRNAGVELLLRTAGDAAVPPSYGCLPGVAGCTTSIAENQWSHVAAVFKSGKIHFYVNGALVRVEATTSTVIQTKAGTDVFGVGAQNAQLTNGFHGRLDDVAIYPRALDGVEIQQLTVGGPTGDNPERCDSLDNDCDSSIDEDFKGGSGLGTACDGVDGDICTAGKLRCQGQLTGLICDDSTALAYWPCNEAQGVVATDHSGGGHDAVLQYDTKLVNAGKINGALLLSGESGAYGDAGNVDLLGGKSAATWAAWIKAGSTQAGKTVIVETYGSSSAGSGKSWAFGRDGKGLFLRLRTNADGGVTPPTYECTTADGCVIKTNKWTHVAVVYDAPTNRFYFDGELAATSLGAGTAIATKKPTERLLLGGDTTGDFANWKGKLDEVQVFGSVLTAVQIRALYDQAFGKGLDACDGLDNDCDGQTDEEHLTKGTVCDGADTDQCSNGTWTCTSDGASLECVNESITDIADVCNGLDDDCDGVTDQGYPNLGTACDSDDADSCAEGRIICSADQASEVCGRDGPSAVWTFTEGVGLTANDTAGTPFNTMTLTTDVSWIPGKTGTAIQFSGTNSFATATTALDGATSLELWVKPFGNTPGYVYGQSSPTSMHFGGLWAGGVLTHQHYEASGTLRTVSGALPADGKWHHVFVVMNPVGSEGLKLYIDGALSSSASLLSNTAIGDFTLGALLSSPINDVYVGGVDDVAVYAHEVSFATVVDHYKNGLPNLVINREICDGVDNDCDGTTDDEMAGTPGAACDGDDADLCANGVFTCTADRLNVECATETGGLQIEKCNSLDDDCDGSTDEGFVFSGLPIGSACDPPGVCGAGIIECISVTEAGCSTGLGGTDAQATGEACDLLDNDCDGLTDEKLDGSTLTENCYTGPDGTENVGTCVGGIRSCASGVMGGCVGEVIPAALDAECDQIDQDCDGTADDDYADSILCTVDSCINGVTSSVPSDALCDDGNPCTDDTCTAAVASGSGCEYTANDTNVPDPVEHSCGNSCKIPTCENGVLKCVEAANAIPDDGLWCTADKCENGIPQHKIIDDSCLIAEACYQPGAVNPENGCRVCAPRVDPEQWSRNVHVADFDQGLGKADGYTVEELVNGGVSWGLSPLRFVTPVGAETGYSLYFGNGSIQSYYTGVRVAASAISPQMTFPQGVKLALSFYVWMETEQYTGSDKFDTLTVEVRNVSTGERTEVWDSMSSIGGDTAGIFEKIYVDVSAWAGETVQILFTFDSGDGYFNKYEGVYLDKIRIDTACCLTNQDCDHASDVNTCVTNWCDAASKQCLFQETCSECIPTQTSVVWLIDKSTSMTTLTSTGETRWQATKKALTQVLPVYDQNANMGFKFYPSSQKWGSCSVTDQLDLDFHSSADEALGDMIAGMKAFGYTPMAAALAEAYKAYSGAAATSEAGKKYVVLMTDGIETCGGDALAEIEKLATLQVSTIIVAFDTEATRPALTEMAMAGSLPSTISSAGETVYYQVNDLDSLVNAMTSVMSLTTGEVCNGIDDNCDGTVDNGVPEIACNLTCNSGAGGKKVCSGGEYGECSVKKVNELCDAIDNDCDGLTDENWPGLGKPCAVGSGDCLAIGKYICSPYLTGPVICNATPKFTELEVCDGKDNDCDGLTDEDIYQACTTACGSGYEVCNAGQFVNCSAAAALAEACNGVDDDCNDVVDDIPNIPCTGTCGPGYKLCVDGKMAGCSTDGVAEICDGLDNDCDGDTDEGEDGQALQVSCIANPNLVGNCKEGQQKCLAGGKLGTCVPLQMPSAELCDGLDNDCDGLTDEDATGSPVAIDCYTGDSNTQNVGACTTGKRSCGPGGTYGDCLDEVLPSTELCDGIDNDCDGVTDEEPAVICALEPGCAAGYCLCGPDQYGSYFCYLD